jgi:hypothetical protein
MKIIYIVLSILLSSTLYAQQRADSKYFSWDSKNNKMIFYPCNCDFNNSAFRKHSNQPYRNEIEPFPYLGINMLAIQIDMLSDRRYSRHYRDIYEGLEFLHLNTYNNVFLPIGEFQYYTIEKKNDNEDNQIIVVISDTSNQSYSRITIMNVHGYIHVRVVDPSNYECDNWCKLEKLKSKYSSQVPEYFLFNSLEYSDEYDKNNYSISRLVYQNDSIQQYLKTSVTSFPAWKPPYQPSKNIQRFSPIISKNIKKQLTKNLSFEDLEAINDNKVLITNTLDDLGRVKKQSYTLGKGFWTAEVILLHNYGIDTDTMRHYVCHAYKLRGLDTVLVMTAIYKNKKLISLYQNLLEQYLKEYYYKKYFAHITQVYPVLPVHNLTYQVFYNEAGDVKQIIMPVITYWKAWEAPYYNCNSQPYDICILNFEYSDYDAKGNWQTVTVVGEKGEDQNESCGYKEVFSRKIKYKENP